MSIGQIPWNKGKVDVYSRKTKIKMSESHKGKIPWNKDLKGEQVAWNKDLKMQENKSAFQKGHKINLGKKCSKGTKEKISEANRGKKRSEETKKKIRIAAKKQWENIPLEKRRNILKKATTISQNTFMSSIEVAIKKVLDNLGIRYIAQKRIGFYLVDIYIPDKKLIIECNGDYWHSLPHRKIRDRRLQTYCNNRGIKLLWLWESDIKLNPESALSEGLKEININL